MPEIRPMSYSLAQPLTLIISAWLFGIWGIDIIGKLLLVRGNLQYVGVAVDYFMKYMEAEALAIITTNRIINVYTSIFYRYGVPIKIVSNNGTQFDNAKFRRFYDNHKVQNGFSTVARP